MSEGTVDMNTRACPRCGGLVVHAKDCETETVKALRQQLAEGIAEGRGVEPLDDETVQRLVEERLARNRYENGEHERKGT